MVTTESKECLGQCPHCGSDNINYETCEILDETLQYPAVCEDCGGEFNENYNINYSETTYNKKEEG